MYNYISGLLVKRDPAIAVVEAAGVGYEIKISLNTYSSLSGKENCKLLTYLHITDNSQTLFGFVDESEKSLFLQLISISGIGPSTGLAILSSLSVDEIKDAIISGNVKTIQSVKGIGAKTAQRVILELKDKLEKEGFVSTSTENANVLGEVVDKSKTKSEALDALLALGIQKNTAEKSINTIIKKFGNNLKVEELIKLALKTN